VRGNELDAELFRLFLPRSINSPSGTRAPESPETLFHVARPRCVNWNGLAAIPESAAVSWSGGCLRGYPGAVQTERKADWLVPQRLPRLTLLHRR
jgi:hypothetical protein